MPNGKLEARLHGHLKGIGPHHATLLEKVMGIGRKRDGDPDRALPHLHPKVKTQQIEVRHSKQVLHLASFGHGDHQIAHLDADEESCPCLKQCLVI